MDSSCTTEASVLSAVLCVFGHRATLQSTLIESRCEFVLPSASEQTGEQVAHQSCFMLTTKLLIYCKQCCECWTHSCVLNDRWSCPHIMWQPSEWAGSTRKFGVFYIYCPKSIYQPSKNTNVRLEMIRSESDHMKKTSHTAPVTVTQLLLIWRCLTFNNKLSGNGQTSYKLLFVLQFIALSLFNKKQACLNGRLLPSFTVSDLLRKGSHVSY